MRKRLNVLVTTGLLICSISQIVTHYIKLPDFASGVLMGIGLGLMILSFIKPSHHSPVGI